MKVKSILICFVCLLLLSGCGKGDGGPEPTEADLDTAQWKKDGFALSGKVEDKQAFWVEEQVAWPGNDLPYDYHKVDMIESWRSISRGGCAYRLYAVKESRASLTPARVLLDIYDTDAMERSVKEYPLEELWIDDESGYIEEFDVLGDGSYAMNLIGYSREGESYRLLSSKIKYFGDKSKDGTADVMPVYLDKGIVQELRESLFFRAEFFCDGAGNSYIRRDNLEALYVLNTDGELIQEYEFGEREQLGVPIMAEDGTLIFPLRKDQGTSLCWFDLEAGECRVLAEMEHEWVERLYAMQGQYLFYEGPLGLIRWDVATGARQLVLDYTINGIELQGQYRETMLLTRQGKPPVLRVYDHGREDRLLVLTETPVKPAGSLRIVSLGSVPERVKAGAALAGSRMGCTCSIEKPDAGNEKEFRDRILTQMVSGEGPDILYVSRADARLLQEKGLLADLEQIVPEEALSRMIPGAVELGKVDGVMTGIPSGVAARSLLVDRGVYEGDTWTLEELLDLMFTGRLEGRILMNSRTSYYYPLAVVRILVDYSLEDSFLIDWEAMECHFEDERFVRFLECAAQYGDGSRNGQAGEGEGPAGRLVEASIGSLRALEYFQGSRNLGDSHYIGFPTRKGSGSYLDTDGLLVVRKDPENPDAVSKFFEIYLGDKVQIDTEDFVAFYDLPVVYIPTDQIRFDEERENAWFREIQVPVFQDGTTALEEANEFLSRCTAAPESYPFLEEIIYEELSHYFEEDDRTAQDTAEVIDNRIQLYLDENNGI